MRPVPLAVRIAAQVLAGVGPTQLAREAEMREQGAQAFRDGVPVARWPLGLTWADRHEWRVGWTREMSKGAQARADERA